MILLYLNAVVSFRNNKSAKATQGSLDDDDDYAVDGMR
jgi:hypothetical protein